MVIHKNFHDLFETVSKDTVLSLPVCKDNYLEITYGDVADVVDTVYSGSKPPLPFAKSDVFEADVCDWRRLSALSERCKAVYEVTFNVHESNFSFQAGDTIGIIPHNIDSEVESLLTHLNLSMHADSCYLLKSTNSKTKIPPHVPIKSTLRHAFKHCLDIRSVLKKLFLLALSQHTKDESERKILEYLCSKEGSTAYQTHILDNNMCLLDIFNIFKSCKPPVTVLLAHLPRLLPRPYSIVNSGKLDNKTLKICFSVLPPVNNRKGLTTGWLQNIILNMENSIEHKMSNLNLNDCDTKKVPIYLRKNISGFMLPQNIEKPIILIGPGTGVAPYMAFLEELEKLKADHDIGEVWLFFGCRDPQLDFIYENELKGFVSRGVLKKLCTAFSRIDNNEEKYIQDSISKHSKDISKLIDSGASIFVCGDVSKMAASVRDCLVECLVNGGKDRQQALELILEMQKLKKYVVDTWS